jgi:prepilin-type N-terminal cleavage/methylation domain-containing protein/prepilin-type processing-associated H-X9-DG protein
MKWRAFTLIELLVVIGIITVLTAIVLPVTGLVRQITRSVRCGSNLHQLSIKLINYDVKNERFPYSLLISSNEPPGGYYGNFSYDTAGWRWFNYIIGDSKNDLQTNSLLWCPSRKMENKFKLNMLVANYGVNQAICKSWGTGTTNEFSGAPLGSTDIRSPSDTLLIVDSGYSTINWYHVTNSPPTKLGASMDDHSYLPGLSINKERNLPSEQKNDAFNGRHLNKSVNAGFVDGHVERKKADDLFVEKTLEGYKNLTPLWLPKKK